MKISKALTVLAILGSALTTSYSSDDLNVSSEVVRVETYAESNVTLLDPFDIVECDTENPDDEVCAVVMFDKLLQYKFDKIILKHDEDNDYYFVELTKDGIVYHQDNNSMTNRGNYGLDTNVTNVKVAINGHIYY